MNSRHSHLRRWLPAAGLLLALPLSADAHTAIAGVGDFFGGVLHPLTTPAHLLILLALGLLAGQRSPLNLGKPLAAFIPLSGLALLLTTTGAVKSVPLPLLVGIALFASALVVLANPLGSAATVPLFGLAAFALGLDSVADNATGLGIAKTLLGTWFGLTLGVVDIAYYLSFCTKHQWQRTGIRVAGSWITAASFMVLAFAFRR